MRCWYVNICKRSKSVDLISEACCQIFDIVAFANTAGGTILIGVKDKANQVYDIEEPLALEERLANLVTDHIEPQLLPEIEDSFDKQPMSDFIHELFLRHTFIITDESLDIYPRHLKMHFEVSWVYYCGCGKVKEANAADYGLFVMSYEY